MEKIKNNCGKCASEKLNPGWLTPIYLYYPSKNKKLLSTSPRIFASACLECGYIELNIDQDELKKILK